MASGLPRSYRGKNFGAPERTYAYLGRLRMQMNIQELGTIMEQKAPVKIICQNNNY
jgi:acetolactate synthase-1/2/3 large subunit